MAIDSVPRRSLEDLLADPPHARGASIDTLWRNGGSVIGSLGLLVDGERRSDLDLLDAVKVIAMSETRDAAAIAHVLENARPSSPSDSVALHSAASLALTRPEVMKWITANPDRVAASPNWIASLPGLGGAVVSVPLAEEALGNLIAAKADLSRDLTRFVQLNPWFTRRFAIQLRRHTGGKRVRFQDRAETARAWSHARSLLGTKLPQPWRSRHGRGSRRGLDEWSHRFLVRYSALVRTHYEAEGISPVMAALFATASAADNANPPRPDAVAGWRSLPAAIEEDALNLIGLGPSPVPALEPEAPRDTGIFPFKASRAMIPKISWR